MKLKNGNSLFALVCFDSDGGGGSNGGGDGGGGGEVIP